ncbi:MAG: nucleotidyltransferase domain-containing protein [Bacilli bacterium]|jgi:predicted nucleotidyltransferase
MPLFIIISLVVKMNLREYRNSLGITIQTAADAVGVPLRTYKRYEYDENHGDILKRKSIINLLKSKYEITEDKGILSIDMIKNVTKSIFDKYADKIEFCYLFGSYAKGNPTDTSDIDLCISTSLTGLKFVGLIEELRISLHKKVDLLRFSDLKDNMDLLNEIMKDGVKIYEQQKE